MSETCTTTAQGWIKLTCPLGIQVAAALSEMWVKPCVPGSAGQLQAALVRSYCCCVCRCFRWWFVSSGTEPAITKQVCNRSLFWSCLTASGNSHCIWEGAWKGPGLCSTRFSQRPFAGHALGWTSFAFTQSHFFQALWQQKVPAASGEAHDTLFCDPRVRLARKGHWCILMSVDADLKTWLPFIRGQLGEDVAIPT